MPKLRVQGVRFRGKLCEAGVRISRPISWYGHIPECACSGLQARVPVAAQKYGGSDPAASKIAKEYSKMYIS